MQRSLDGFLLMTPAQSQWVTLMREARALAPTRRPAPPRLLAALRRPAYDLALSRGLELLMYTLILLNVALLATEHYGMEAAAAYFAVRSARGVAFTFHDLLLAFHSPSHLSTASPSMLIDHLTDLPHGRYTRRCLCPRDRSWLPLIAPDCL